MYGLILAGGQGTRLAPLTDHLPKALVPVAGYPIIDRQLEWLKAGGVTDVMLLVGHRHRQLQDHVQDGGHLGLRVEYSAEEQPLGRGGAIRRGLELVQATDPIVVLNGDVLTTMSLAWLVEDWRRRQEARRSHSPLAVSVLAVPMPSPYGVVEVAEDGRITEFKEKGDTGLLINGGVYVMHAAINSWFPRRGDHETTLFPLLAKQGWLASFRYDGYWQSIDSLVDLARADAFWEGS